MLKNRTDIKTVIVVCIGMGLLALAIRTQINIKDHKLAKTNVDSDEKAQVSPADESMGFGSEGLEKQKNQPQSGAKAPVVALPQKGLSEIDPKKYPQQAVQNACKIATFRTQDPDTRERSHKLVFTRTISAAENLCLKINGKSVAFYVKVNALIAQYRFKNSKEDKVELLYCSQGGSCGIECPLPEKNFWDRVAKSSPEESSGFNEQASSEEQALQKELVALKEVLNRKPAKESSSAIWTLDSSKDYACK